MLFTSPRHCFWELLSSLQLLRGSLSTSGSQRMHVSYQIFLNFSSNARVNNTNAGFGISMGKNCCIGNKHRHKAYGLTYAESHKRGYVTSVSDEDLATELSPLTDIHGRNIHGSVWDNQNNDTNEESDDRIDERIQDVEHRLCHVPVMVREVLDMMQPKNGQIIVDMTFGAGGHAREILKVAPDVHYIASDRDPSANNLALKFASENSRYQVTPLLGRFSELPVNLQQHGIKPGTVDAFLFDLGASSMQFDTPSRGFSLSRDGPLDMRMDADRIPGGPTAADVVNCLDSQDLAHILKKYGEERKSVQIAHAIVEARYAYGKFTRTKQLADVISTVFNSGSFRLDKMSRHAHVATKTFQALRIFVNNELNEVHNGLQVARHYLRPHGRCVVISFHSLEDRIVKRHFLDIDIDQDSNMTIHDHFRNSNVSFDVEQVKQEFMAKLWQPVSRKVIEPTEDECLRNPRARSAKLRAALKLENV